MKIKKKFERQREREKKMTEFNWHSFHESFQTFRNQKEQNAHYALDDFSNFSWCLNVTHATTTHSCSK